MKNHTGERFGALLLTKRLTEAEQYGAREVAWYEVLCDCGTVKHVRWESIRKGDTKSCGCGAHRTRDDYVKPVHGKTKLRDLAEATCRKNYGDERVDRALAKSKGNMNKAIGYLLNGDV